MLAINLVNGNNFKYKFRKTFQQRHLSWPLYLIMPKVKNNENHANFDQPQLSESLEITGKVCFYLS